MLKLKGIQHPNLLQVMDYGQDDSIHFVVTEYIDASVLKFLFRIRYFSLRKIKQLLLNLLDLFQLFEQKQVNHYAFQSASILYSRQGIFKFIAFQPQLINAIADQTTIANPTLVPTNLNLSEQVMRQYRFYSLGMLWLESQLDQLDFDKLVNGSQNVLKQQVLLEHDPAFCRLCMQAGEQTDIELIRKKIRMMSDFSKSVNQLAPNLMSLLKPVLIGLSNDIRSHLIAGSKGSGKTTLLNFISNHLKQSNYHLFVYSGRFEINRSASLLHNLLSHLIKTTQIADSIYDEQSDHFLHYLNTEHDCSFSLQTKSIDYKTDSDLLLENSIRFLNQVLLDQDLIICIDDLQQLDRDSIKFLNLAISQTQRMRVFLIACLLESELHFFQKKIADGESELLFIDSMNQTETQDFVRMIMETDDVQAKLLTNKLYSRSKGHLKSCSDILTVLRKEWVQSEASSDLVELMQEMIQVNLQERFAAKLEQYKKFAELIIFITLLKKPISIELLNEIFSNNHVFSEILNHLVSDQIIDFTEFAVRGYWVENEHNSTTIIHFFDEELIKELIKQFLTNPLIKSYFDYDKAAKYLVVVKDYKLAVELYIKLANLHRYQHTHEAAVHIYRRALDLVQNYQVEISKTILNQVTEYLADSNFKIKSYSAALHYFTLYLNENSDLLLEKKIEIQLRRVECHIEMEQIENARILISECEEEVVHQQNRQLNIRLIRNKAKILYVAGNYDEAILSYEQLVNHEDSLNADYYQVIQEMIDCYSELNQYDQLIEFIQTVLKKSQFLMSYETSRLRFQLATIHYNQSNLEEAESLLKQCINIASASFDMHTLSEAKSYLGAVRILQSDSQQAINEFNEAYEILSKIGLMDKAAHLKSAVAVIYKDSGQISKAIDAEEQAIDLFERQQNTRELVYSYTNLGHIYYHAFDIDQAKQLFKKALNLAESTEFIEGICHANLFLSAIFSSKDQFDKADSILADTLNLIDLKDSANYIHYIYYKSYLDYRRGFYTDAWNQLIMCFESESIARNKKYNFIFSYLLGAILFKQQENEKSKQVLEKALILAEKQNNRIYQFYILSELSQVERLLGESSGENQEKLKTVTDQIVAGIDDPVLQKLFIESKRVTAMGIEGYEEKHH